MKRLTAKRTALVVGLIGLAVLVVVGLWLWSRRPPQMGADGEVFKTVDALFTAVTARDEKLVAACARRLLPLKDTGKLPPDAADYLDNVIGRARAGRWESAAQTLYHFMKVQRRDGAHGHPSKKHDKARTGAEQR